MQWGGATHAAPWPLGARLITVEAKGLLAKSDERGRFRSKVPPRAGRQIALRPPFLHTPSPSLSGSWPVGFPA